MGSSSLFAVFFCAFTLLASTPVEARRENRVAARVAERRAARIAAGVAERVENRINEAVQGTADTCACECAEDGVEMIEAAGEDEEGVAVTALQVVVLCTAACYEEAVEAMEEAGEDGFVLEDLDGAVVAQGEAEA